MSAIADLVTFLLSTGLPPDIVSVAVDLATKHGNEQVEIHLTSTRHPPDIAAEKRREWDRNYRKRKRESTRRESSAHTYLLQEESKKEEVRKERRARARKQLVMLPEDWKPPDSSYELAKQFGTTVPQVEAIFRDYLKSSGKLYADHNAAFNNFIRNQRKFNGHSHEKASDNPARGSLIGAIDRRLAEIERESDPALPEDNLFSLPNGPIQRP